MTIAFNSKFYQEKKYVIHCLFNEFLGLNYNLNIDDE